MPVWKRFILRGHVWLVATLIPLLVRVLPLRYLLRLLTPPARFRPYRDVDLDEVRRLVARRLAEPRNMRRRACLREGLTLFHFLRLGGKPAVLQFGVLPVPDAARRLHAHCWVTVDGQAASEPAAAPSATMLVHGGSRNGPAGD